MRVIEEVRKAVRDLKANERFTEIQIGPFALEAVKLEAGWPMSRPNPKTLLGIPVIVNEALGPDTIHLVAPGDVEGFPKVVTLKL